ncbi:hypothetical protein CF326_g9893, partial [Tilletia indica]
MKDVVRLLGERLGKQDRNATGLFKSAVSDVEEFRVECHSVGLQADQRALDALSRAQRHFEDFQGQAQRDFEVLRERAFKDFVKAQENAALEIQMSSRQRDQEVDHLTHRLSMRMQAVASERGQDEGQLYAMLRASSEDVDKKCRTAQLGWLRAESQLLGSNVWALAWPEAARSAEARIREGEGRVVPPPEYETAGRERE